MKKKNLNKIKKIMFFCQNFYYILDKSSFSFSFFFHTYLYNNNNNNLNLSVKFCENEKTENQKSCL